MVSVTAGSEALRTRSIDIVSPLWTETVPERSPPILQARQRTSAPPIARALTLGVEDLQRLALPRALVREDVGRDHVVLRELVEVVELHLVARRHEHAAQHRLRLQALHHALVDLTAPVRDECDHDFLRALAHHARQLPLQLREHARRVA